MGRDAIATPRYTRRFVRTLPAVQLAGLIVATIVVVFGGIDSARALRPLAVAPDAASLDAARGRAVTVACTQPIVDPGLALAADDGEDPADANHVLLCPFGDRALVVVTDHRVAPGELAGVLRAASADDVWAPPLRARERELGPVYAAGWLDLTTGTEDRILRWLVVALGFGVLVGWGLFVRRALRRRRLA
jgi:hypothetical protein